MAGWVGWVEWVDLNPGAATAGLRSAAVRAESNPGAALTLQTGWADLHQRVAMGPGAAWVESILWAALPPSAARAAWVESNPSAAFVAFVALVALVASVASVALVASAEWVD